MTNEEIAVRLTAAVLEPGILMPSRRESDELHDAMAKNAAQFAVRVYRMILEALELPADSTSTR